MSLKMYEYKGCGTCKKAQEYLEANGIEYKKIAIRKTPPTPAELKKMLKYMGGEVKKLFNTSGMDYRAMDIKSKLPDMSDKEAITLLSENGNLVKRPFVLGKDWGIVGFKEDVWNDHLS